MEEQLSNKIIFENAPYFNQFQLWASSFFENFEGYNTSRVIILFLVISVVFLLAIFVIALHIKALATSIFNNTADNNVKSSKNNAKKQQKELEISNQKELELEQELQKELEMQILTKKSLNWCPLNNENDKDKSKEKDKDNKIELDWDKYSKIDLDASLKVMPNIAYVNEEKSLKSYIALTVEMLSRNIDEFKIAQTLMYKSKNYFLEHDVLQMIDCLNSFSMLCAKGAFNSFAESQEEAVIALMSNDITQALLLIEKLMDAKIDLASQAKDDNSKNVLLQDTSNLANLFGTMASLEDDDLALGAFELSLEINPENVNSWSKIGNIYSKKSKTKKAVWAYENALELSTLEENSADVANSQNMLSQYYYAAGETKEASEMYNKSKSFYDMIGITRHLDKHEIEIVKNIEDNKLGAPTLEDAVKFINKNVRIA